MSNIIDTLGINDGHTKSGPGSGAVGMIVESVETRKVGSAVRRKLNERGYKAVNCTIDYAKTTNESLALIIQQANRHDLDWFISIHFNAGGGRGVEVYTYKGRQYPDAVEVCENIALLGFRNRGVKAGTGLYVIRKTKAKSMLIEVCFVDTDDAHQYLKVGHEAIADAIVNALVGYAKPISPKPAPEAPPAKPKTEHPKTVADIQRFLNKEISAGLKIDNAYGGKTKAALIKMLQKYSGAEQDGVWGPDTEKAVKNHTRRRGDYDHITMVIQMALIGKGYSVGTAGADKDFGANTEKAVKDFQGAGNDDGIVGIKTYRKLFN